MLYRTMLPAAAAAAIFMQTASAQTVTVAPAAAHPTESTTISGTGFADQEAVDVYLDTTDTLLLVASATGTLSGTLTVPAGATPGLHYVTAIGRRSGDAAQKPFTVTTPWLQAGFGAAGLDFNPFETTIGTGNAGTLGPLWNLPNSNDTGATATVTGGRVYNATTHGLQALSTKTGAVLWTAIPTVTIYASPAIAGADVYVGTGSGSVYAINATTGAVIWTATLGSFTYSSPVVVNGIVYVGCYDNKVYALNASTGAVVWTYTTGAAIDGVAAVSAGIVYIGSEDDSVYALNATTGALAWSYKTGAAVESGMLVAEGLLFATSDDGNIYAIRTVGSPIGGVSAGTVLWSATGASYETPAYAQNTVFYGYSTLYAVDARTGKQLWSFAPDTAIRGHIIVADNVVYFTSASGLLYGVNAATGAEIWHTLAGADYLGGPSISDGVVYVSAYETGTTAYALLAGTSIRQRPAPHIRSLHPNKSLTVTR